MNTCRRIMIDEYLKSCDDYINGQVLDIGGKKEGKRGEFRPPINKMQNWRYLNIDHNSLPDILASAESIPLPDDSIDTFLMCEVLEYLEKPEICLKEAFRILKSGGYGIITMPFLHPVHPDSYDYQRWTVARLALEIKNAGLELIEINEFGGLFAVISDFYHVIASDLPAEKIFIKRFIFLFLRIVRAIFPLRINRSNSRINTGYGLVVRKPLCT
jgi:SAM-dependent methyltransferase